jgi:Helix-turn-helix domain
VTDQERTNGKRARRRRRSTGDPALGIRLRKARNRVGLSLVQAAHQVERSDRWLLMVENGRADPGYGDLARLAPVLNVKLEQLVLAEQVTPPTLQPSVVTPGGPAMMRSGGQHPANGWLEVLRRRGFLQAGLVTTGGVLLGLWPAVDERTQAPELATLRRALLHYGPEAATEPPDLAMLEGDVRAVSADTQASRYSRALRLVPSILSRARIAVQEAGDDDRPASSRLLAHAYRLHVEILRKFGDAHLAVIAADRGLSAAKESGDAATVASAVSLLCDALADSRHYQQAIDLCTQAAADVGPEGTSCGRDVARFQSVYGRLLLSGAEAAAQSGDRGLSDNFYREADGVARLLGRDANHSFTAFGPTNVLVHRVHAAVVLGDGERAVQLARGLDLARLPVVERQAHHLMDVALAHGLMDNAETALSTLLTAEQIAPEAVRLDSGARALVDDLHSRHHHRGSQLRDLAGRMQRST